MYEADGELARAAWHMTRAAAHRERWARLGACGTSWELRASCPEHGTLDASAPVRCGHVRLCVTCRGVRAREYREQLSAVVRHWRDPRATYGELVSLKRWHGVQVQAHALRLTGAAAHAPRSDRWSMRLVTLTVPHREAGSDVRAVLDSWRGFVRKLRAHYRKRGHRHAPGYVRVLEVTPGTHEGGHAHIHALVWGPFVRLEMLRHWWGGELDRRGYPVPSHALSDVLDGTPAGSTTVGGAARRRAELTESLVRWRGRGWAPVERVHWPIVDVRRVALASSGELELRDSRGATITTGEAGIAAELVKYLVKDIGPTGERCSPELLASVYAAAEGRRLITAGVGAWGCASALALPTTITTCACCGALPEWNPRRVLGAVDCRGPPPAEGAKSDGTRTS